MSLSIDANDVPRVFRIIVKLDGEQIANTTTYAKDSEVDTLHASLTSAYAGEGMSAAVIEIFPA